MPTHPHASQELVMGYVQTALKAEKRRAEAEAAHDRQEAKEWAKIARYAWMMAEFGLVDEPDSFVSYYAFDETRYNPDKVIDVMDDADAGKVVEWDSETQGIVGAAINVLSPTERAIADLYILAQVKRAEAAELLRMPLGTLDVHLRDIRRKWRAFAEAKDRHEPIQQSVPVFPQT